MKVGNPQPTPVAIRAASPTAAQPLPGPPSTPWINSSPSCPGKQVSRDGAKLLFGTGEGCVPLTQQKKLGQAEGNSLLKAGLGSEGSVLTCKYPG